MFESNARMIPKSADVTVDAFKGLNRSNSAVFGQCVRQKKISLREYPYLCPAKGKAPCGDYENASAVFSWEKLCVVDGGKLYCGEDEICSLLPGEKQFAAVNGKLVIFPDKIMVDKNDFSVQPMSVSVTSAGDAEYTDRSITLSGRKKIKSGELFLQSAQDRFLTYGKIQSAVIYSEQSGWTLPASESKKADELSRGDIVILKEDGSLAKQSEGTGVYSRGMYAVVEYAEIWQISGVQIKADVYKADEEAKNLSSVFAIGDRVDFSGFTVRRNNVKGVEITEIDDESNSLVFADGTLSAYKWFYTVTGEESWTSDYARFSDGTASHSIPTQLTGSAGGGRRRFICPAGTVLTFVSDDLWIIYYPDNTSEEMQGSASTEGYLLTFSKEGSVTATLPVPDFDFICSCENRLWGVCNRVEDEVWDERRKQFVKTVSRVIYASALGLPNRFSDFSGVDTDSYSVAVGSKGDFTGAIAYNGDPIFFKENELIRIGGHYPSDYTAYFYDIPGIKAGCHKSAALCNHSIFYLGTDGVYRFTGSTAKRISYPLGEKGFGSAVAAADLGRYTVSMTDREGNAGVYVYDTRCGLWSVEDGVQMQDIAVSDGKVYSVCGGRVYESGADNADLEWLAELAPLSDRGFRVLRMTEMFLRADIPQGAYLTVELLGDGGKVRHQKTIRAEGLHSHRIALEDLRACELTVRLSGKGNVIVRKIELRGTLGSEEVR